MIQVPILVGDLHNGHLGSDDVIGGHQRVFANNLRLKRDTDMGWSHCLVKTHRHATWGNMLTSRDLDLRSNFDLTVEGRQVYASTRLDESNKMVPELGR